MLAETRARDSIRKPAAAEAMKNVNKKKIVYALEAVRRIRQFARSARKERSEAKINLAIFFCPFRCAKKYLR